MLKEISQISIYLKDEAERVNEVALFAPLQKNSRFDEESKPVRQRKWKYTQDLSIFQKIPLKIGQFLFKHIPVLIPRKRRSTEAKFKTVLAILLAQEPLREFFLHHPKRRENFFESLKQIAISIGYTNFQLPQIGTPLAMSQQLTQFKDSSLIEDATELNLQIAALNSKERNELLFKILNQIERPPITSVLEVSQKENLENIVLTTKYARYKVKEINSLNGNIPFTYEEDLTTSSIHTLENIQPGAKGARNQRIVTNTEEQLLGAYCGELSTKEHLLEQILLILGHRTGNLSFHKTLPPGFKAKTKKILFTSLFSWNELGYMTKQHEAIHQLDQKYLKLGEEWIQLHLLHFNIPFGALNKFPAPAETKAHMNDINTESMIRLTWEYWQKRGLASHELEWIATRLLSLSQIPEYDFFIREKHILEEIDRFEALRQTLAHSLDPQHAEDQLFLELLTQKKADGKALTGIDKLLYLDLIAHYLGYCHNKNCVDAMDRSTAANAADKAQYAFKMIHNAPFIPEKASEEESSLFSVLYSMYLVWEEPEINTALSTGFLGENYHRNFFMKNSEATKYLIKWLKKHPEIYQGQSNLRY